MSRALRGRLAAGGDAESGMTLIELLVAASMSVVLVGAVGSMLIGAVRAQPDISERTQNTQTARWVMERLTREIRNGVRVDEAAADRVSFVTKVRRETCGGSGALASEVPARECQVTYDCSSGTACTRTEAEKGDLEGGATTTIFSGIAAAEVFSFEPSAEEASYVGITLRIPNPSGQGATTVSDGASLRTPTLFGG